MCIRDRCIDGNGGAFAVWLDKNGSGTYRGTHLSSDGPLTIGQGEIVSSQVSGGFSLEYSGNGSAVMVWSEGVTLDIFECSDNEDIYFDESSCLNGCSSDCESGTLESGDIRAQRFNSNMETLWDEDDTNSGKVICDDEYLQSKAKVTTFGDNVVVVWRDLRNDDDGDIYAQIINSNGDNLLADNGVVVCDDDGQQVSPRVKTDGTHAFIYWEDKRNNIVDPYVQ